MCCKPWYRVGLLASMVVLVGFISDGNPVVPAPASTDEIERLVQRLGSTNAAEREGATERLRRLGEAALDPLQKAVRESKDADVRRGAQNVAEAIIDHMGRSSEVRRCQGPDITVSAAALFQDEQRALLASDGENGDAAIRVWDLQKDRELSRLQGSPSTTHTLDISRDERQLLSGTWRVVRDHDQYVVRLWSLESSQVVRKFEGHINHINSAAFSPDGRLALSGSSDKTIRLWNLQTGAELKRFEGHGSSVVRAIFSSDGRRIASCSWDGTVRVWDAGTGKELRCFQGHRSTILSMAFSADGRRILSAHGMHTRVDDEIVPADCTLRLWDVESGQELREFEGHQELVLGVAFSPDGNRALSWSRDLTVRLWDVETGDELRRFKVHSKNKNREAHKTVIHAAFTKDGRQAISFARDGTIQVWTLPDVARPIARARKRPPADASAERVPAPREAEDPLRRLDAPFADIEREVSRLRNAGRQEQAQRLEAHLNTFKNWTRGPYVAPQSDEPEVHVVGVYHGKLPRGAERTYHPQGIVDVKVTHTAAPIILVLCAYEPVKWSVETRPGVRLQTVVLGGYHLQEAGSIPNGVPVVPCSHEAKSPDWFYAYTKDFESYPNLVKKVRRLTQRKITTFQGVSDHIGDPVVGPESDSWRAQHILLRIAETHRDATEFERNRVLADMRKIRFHGVQVTGAARFRTSAALGEFTPLGPIKGSLKPIPGEVKHLAFDPIGLKHYAITAHEVGQIDFAKNVFVPMQIDANLPRLSWPGGLTFDTKRRRLVLVSPWHMYTYDVDKQAWSVLADMNRLAGPSALAYSPEEDILYGLPRPLGEGAIRTLYHMNEKGTVIKKVRLTESIPLGSPPLSGPQLVSVGKDLIVITSPLPDTSDEDVGSVNSAYVIDPHTGKIRFSTKQQLQDKSP